MTLAVRANPSAPIGARDPLRAFLVVACDVAQSHALACASEGNNVRGLGACIVPRVAECCRHTCRRVIQNAFVCRWGVIFLYRIGAPHCSSRGGSATAEGHQASVNGARPAITAFAASWPS